MNLISIHRQTSFYNAEIIICFAFRFEEGAFDNAKHISYDPEITFAAWVKFDNDGSDKMHFSFFRDDYCHTAFLPVPFSDFYWIYFCFLHTLFSSCSWGACVKQWINTIQMAGGTTGPVGTRASIRTRQKLLDSHVCEPFNCLRRNAKLNLWL